MTTELDLEFPQLAVDMLAEFGLDATFIVRTKTYGPGEVSTGKTTYGSQPNVVAKASPPWPYGIPFRQGVTSTEGDAVTIIQSQDLSFTPRNGMPVVIDTRQWTITQVDPIKSGELTAAYLLRIQR